MVCSNLQFHGDITVMRKHTKNILTELEDLTITTLYKAQYQFAKLIRDAEAMKGHPLDDSGAFRLMGLLYGRDILSPRQIPVVREQWLRPAHSEFQPRNMFSFYNAVTESLKSSPPTQILERHINLHKTITEEGREVWGL